MPITQARYAAHLEEWQGKAGIRYWPKYLFHYAHVTAAAAVLRNGRFVCRAAQPELLHDVAEPGALGTNPDALNFVRLYFRPLTPFHLSTEGIKFRNDPYRRERHMSVPIALLLDAEKVLTANGVGFSDRKLAHPGEAAHFDNDCFDRIPFSDVYHHGPTGLRLREIHDRRMAEVVVPNELPLGDCLKFVICRTIYDEMTLRRYLGDVGSDITSRIRVASNATEFFFCWGTFIHLLEVSERHVRLKLFQGRNYARDHSVRCKIEQLSGEEVIAEANFADEINDRGVRVGPFPDTAEALWRIHIEDVLAFNAQIPQTRSELVPRS